MLVRRGILLERARVAVNESGYHYKKGKSRSKKFGSEVEVRKRPKLDSDYRSQRIEDIDEELKTVSSSISFKEQRIENSSKLRNFKVCDQLNDEVDSLQQRRRTLECERRALVKKEKRSKQYHRKKTPKGIIVSSSDSESGRSSRATSTASSTPSPMFSPRSRSSPFSQARASLDKQTSVEEEPGALSGDTVILSGSESEKASDREQSNPSSFL